MEFRHHNHNLPKDKAFIFSYKIEEHLSVLDRTNFSQQNKQKQLIHLLMQHHQENYRSNELPTYEYSDLKKGIYCPECFSFEHTNTLRNRTCQCGFKETIVEALVRSIEENSVLFPNDKITVSVVYDWLDKEYDKQKIQRTLKNHFQVKGENKGTYYC
ncbi:hypothetical protein GCM10008932_08280 [Alkalibacterium iburiense]|uniref:Uncharacterized protein n=1 Tax=Alkalibacterium iburiense TaxID=290589 RepID=A0ABP3H075_9LACT